MGEVIPFPLNRRIANDPELRSRMNHPSMRGKFKKAPALSEEAGKMKDAARMMSEKTRKDRDRRKWGWT